MSLSWTLPTNIDLLTHGDEKVHEDDHSEELVDGPDDPADDMGGFIRQTVKIGITIIRLHSTLAFCVVVVVKDGSVAGVSWVQNPPEHCCKH